MLHPTVSPHDPRVVLVGCDMGGTYLTRDGGASWRMFDFGSAPSTFAFDPRRPEVLYVGAGALWRSEDGGLTWRMVLPDGARDTRVRFVTDDADLHVTTGDPAYPSGAAWVRVDAVAFAPARPDALYVALRHRPAARGAPPPPAALLSSADRGATWARLTTLSAERVLALDVAPGGDPVRALDASGVHEGAGGAWRRWPSPTALTAGTFGRGDALHVYATADAVWAEGTRRGGVYASRDGGHSWRSALAALPGVVAPRTEGAARFEAVATSSQHGAVAYAGFRGLRFFDAPEELTNGILRTDDAGATWRLVHRESSRPSPRLEGSWLDARAPNGYPDLWFDAPADLGVAPTDSDVCYATDLFRTYRTLDGGARWAQVHSRGLGDDRWATRGLDVTTAYEVYADPFDLRRVFVAYTDIGLFRSEDGGASWRGSSEGVPAAWRNTAYALAFDPEVRGLVWGAFSGTHDLPRVKMWRDTDPSSWRGGVAVSTDGGRRWRASAMGLPDAPVTHVLVDPVSPRAGRTLYATVFGHGVFRSTDGGATWARKSVGIAGSQPFAWHLTRAADGALYLVVARRVEAPGRGGDGAVYRSTDGAEHWTSLALPAGVGGPTDLAVDVTDPRRLYLSAFAGGTTANDEAGGGVFVSDDGGAHWRLTLAAAVHAYDVTGDARAPSVLYACGFDRAAWRSDDRGETWARLAGFAVRAGHRVTPDPSDPARVYVTTFGGGVWRGPAAGDRSFEDPLVDFRATGGSSAQRGDQVRSVPSRSAASMRASLSGLRTR